jgi:hypothetical protein
MSEGIIDGKHPGWRGGDRRRGTSKADCGEYRQAAGAIALNVTRFSFDARFLGQSGHC